MRGLSKISLRSFCDIVVSQDRKIDFKKAKLHKQQPCNCTVLAVNENRKNSNSHLRWRNAKFNIKTFAVQDS
jgi:hypothetical protein